MSRVLFQTDAELPLLLQRRKFGINMMMSRWNYHGDENALKLERSGRPRTASLCQTDTRHLSPTGFIYLNSLYVHVRSQTSLKNRSLIPLSLLGRNKIRTLGDCESTHLFNS
ncbi:MAG: hypothetical protein OJF51_001366 [Nitrospira sp.]|jgi:hypothetical protein|nr:MAG: hypothetical protein OJF51_001366 [Nitrospira sp.]